MTAPWEGETRLESACNNVGYRWEEEPSIQKGWLNPGKLQTFWCKETKWDQLTMYTPPWNLRSRMKCNPQRSQKRNKKISGVTKAKEMSLKKTEVVKKAKPYRKI